MPTVEQHLHTIARAQGAAPFWVLEKDYALGYVLAGIAQVPALADALVIKGGTALRKFYFADYRFSEDLDFSATTRPPDVAAAMQAAVQFAQALLLEQGPFAVTLERLTLRDPHPAGRRLSPCGCVFPASGKRCAASKSKSPTMKQLFCRRLRGRCSRLTRPRQPPTGVAMR